MAHGLHTTATTPPPSLHPCRCAQAYYSYSLIIMSITLFSIVTNVVSAYQYRRRLAALAHYTCEVQVVHGGRLLTVDSTELLPGDVIVVHPGTLPCDVALVRWGWGRVGRRRAAGCWLAPLWGVPWLSPQCRGTWRWLLAMPPLPPFCACPAPCLFSTCVLLCRPALRVICACACACACL